MLAEFKMKLWIIMWIILDIILDIIWIKTLDRGLDKFFWQSEMEVFDIDNF